MSAELRDVLKEQARLRGRTLNMHLQALAEEESQELRFEALRRSIAANPPDDDYVAEAEDWMSDRWN